MHKAVSPLGVHAVPCSMTHRVLGGNFGRAPKSKSPDEQGFCRDVCGSLEALYCAPLPL